MITRILPAILATAVALGLAACGSDNPVGAESAAPPPAPPATTETDTQTTSETSTETAPVETEPAENETEPASTETTEPAKDDIVVIRVETGEPVGGVQRIEVRAGDRVRFIVQADAAEEVHVHGYDISQDVGPGQDARFDFEADLEGIFEGELENSSVKILELVVNP